MTSPATPPPRLRERLARLLAGLTAAYAVVLVLATHYPKPQEFLGPNPPSDKTLHFVAYGVLAVLAAGTLALARRWTARHVGRLAAGLALFAVVDEATQPLFARVADWLDWVYDCAGIGLGLVAVAATVAAVRGLRGGANRRP